MHDNVDLIRSKNNYVFHIPYILRKQPKFRNATTGFLLNEHKNSIQLTPLYPDLSSVSCAARDI